MQHLWGMVNTLQIISLFPLFNMSVPLNMQLILGMVVNVITFSFFDTSPLEKVFINLTPTSPFSDNFETMDIFWKEKYASHIP